MAHLQAKSVCGLMIELLHQGVIFFGFFDKGQEILPFCSFLLVTLDVMHFKHMHCVVEIGSVLHYLVYSGPKTVFGGLLSVGRVNPLEQLST